MIILTASLITALTAFLIAFAVIFRRHRHLSNVAFFIGLLSTASAIFGDSMCLFMPELLIQWKRVVFISESFMAASWLLFAISFARTNYWDSIGRFSRIMVFLSPLFIVYSVMVPMEDFFYSPEFDIERILFLGNAGYIFNLLLLLYSIVSIIYLESTLKISSGISRWNIKYTLVGVGGVLAINIFYYSHAMLYRSINMNLLPVKTGVTLISILMIGFALLRHRMMDVEVEISRKIFYRSISIFIIGFYLLGLGVLGEGMRYFGPEVGRNITTFLGFAGAILILAVILSEQLRRKVMVFINKNFYSQKYDYREQWLKFSQLISLKHSFEELLSSITEGFKDAVGVRGAAVWLKEKKNGKYVCVKALYTDMVKTQPNRDLVQFLKNRKWVLNIHDIKCREIVAGNSGFIESAMACLIVPLIKVDELIGFIVLRDGLAGNEYNYEDYDLLKTLASQATTAILNARLSEELLEAKEMEAVGRLSSFIIHDLKNAASMLTMISQNAEEHIDNPEFQRDAIRSVSSTSGKIKDIIEKLKNLPKKPHLDIEYSDLGECVKAAVEEMDLNGSVRLSYKEVGSVQTEFDKEEISKVVINLIMNAFDVTDKHGEVRINVGEEKGMAFVKVSDNGCGMSPEFIEKRLFRPFQTTKKKGLGIGLYQCKSVVEAHSGSLKVDSQEGKGTDFFIYLPMVS
ncbi:MAG: PEP-CTERM system histidine kinase PrsK [Thermodesulfovibrionia bacterium]|nr:PEP-CTERM system histidine kinase PrsK [Thermodesulfovibrionia bacterium]